MKKWFKRFKNQKGMTLVELLAVVVILGIVAAIAVPAIGNIIDNSKQDAHKANALLIINSAKLGEVTGAITNSDWTTAGTNKTISVDTLVSKGLLDAVPANPSEKNERYGTSSIVIKGSDNKYSIKLYDSKNTSVSPVVDKTEAQLNGGK